MIETKTEWRVVYELQDGNENWKKSEFYLYETDLIKCQKTIKALISMDNPNRRNFRVESRTVTFSTWMEQA